MIWRYAVCEDAPVGRLWASDVDRQRIARARSAVLLVGSYDGSGNYGDVLQLAAAVETASRVPGSPLPVAIVERETHGHHSVLLRRYTAQLAGAAYVHYQDGEGDFDDDLVELSRVAPKRSVVYVYGGGYLNQRWGGRKVDHVAAAERLAEGGHSGCCLGSPGRRGRGGARRSRRMTCSRGPPGSACATRLRWMIVRARLSGRRRQVDRARRRRRRAVLRRPPVPPEPAWSTST